MIGGCLHGFAVPQNGRKNERKNIKIKNCGIAFLSIYCAASEKLREQDRIYTHEV